MARPLRILQSEFPYHVTTRTNNGSFRLGGSRRHRERVIRAMVSSLNQIQAKYDVRVHHFQLMSNHYHLIVSTPEANLDRAMQFFNSRVALAVNRMQGCNGHLWGGRYKCTILDKDLWLVRCIRYVYQNPVRAGVVARVCPGTDSSYEVYAMANGSF